MATRHSTPGKVKFTAHRVNSFACSPDKPEATLWDTDVPGLGLRATKSGSKAYIFKFQLAGKAGRVRVGNPDAWDIQEARAEARRLKVLVDRGEDPRDEKRRKEKARVQAETQARREEATLGDVWPRYIDAHRGRWSEKYLRDHLTATRPPEPEKLHMGRPVPAGPLYPLLGIRLAELTSERLHAWIKPEVVRRPTYAKLSYAMLRACLGWCEEQPDLKGLVDMDAIRARKVRKEIPKTRAKDDVLQREQLRPWFEAVRQIQNPVQAAYLQALLLTGARREELGALTWEQIDFQWRSLTIKDKVEGERTIPLTPYVAHLLSALPRRNLWVFSSPAAESGRLQEPRIAHNRALNAAGLPHVTIHGLRRSFGTLAEWVECPVGVVAQVMGHKPSATAERHYRCRPLDLLRLWHTKIEGWVLEQAGIEQPTEEVAAQGLHRVK